MFEKYQYLTKLQGVQKCAMLL